jgi:hypothetical protein
VVLPQQKLTCGCIQLWHGRDGVGGPFSNGAKDWWFRVGPMAPIQPQPGDKVGFFLTAGDARLRTDATSVHERSNIVVVTVPASDTAVLTFPAVAPAPTPGPDPAPTPGPAPGPTPGPAPVATVDFSAVLARIDKLENDLKAAVKALDVRLKALEQRPFPIYVAADGSKLVPQ